MKKIFILLLSATSIVACNSSSEKKQTEADTITRQAGDTVAANPSATSNEVLTAYLQLKNALTNDDAKAAGDAGKQLRETINRLSPASMTADQQKTMDEIRASAIEHATHIEENGNNMAHQRQHFDLLSQDIRDLVKTTGTDRTLHVQYCPMYNNQKGAIWLSEVKDIRNPYYGKEMLTCGEQREEINP